MGSTNFTAKDGINKLKKNKPLIIKYLNQSELFKNFLNIRCTNVFIPGDEIGQNSSFYIYNIEGFLDIEKGIYYSLIQLLQAMKFLKENNKSIVSYEDLEGKVNCLMNAVRIVDCITYRYTSEDDKSLEKEQEQKCQCREKTEKIEEKKEESFSFIFDFQKLLFSFSFSFFSSSTNTEEKSFEQINEVEKEDQIKILEKVKNIMKNIDFNQISSYQSFILIIMEFLKIYNIHKYPGIRNAIDFLSNIIPFKELNEIVNFSIRFFGASGSGFIHILQGIQNFPNNKIASFINLSTGMLELYKARIDIFKTYEKVKNQQKEKKLKKTQLNFKQLVNKMDAKFDELINSNLEEFKKNNIIILGIDQSDSNYNEETDLQFFYINNIDNFAKCINKNDKDRAKYIENMIYFYQKILPKFSILTNEGEEEINLKIDFVLSLQSLIINKCNNKKFWIELDKDKIEKFIDFMEKKYEKGKDYFKNNSCEIINKFIQMLEKATNVENKDCKPPAPTID